MSKLMIAMIFLVVDVTLSYAVTISRKYKDDKGRYTTRMIRVGLIITVLCTLILGNNNEKAIEILYGLYFGCFSWLCKCLMDFALAYTDWMSKFRWLSQTAMVVVSIDATSQILNIWFHHNYVPEFYTSRGDVYMIYHTEWPMYVHFLLCYVMLAVNLIMLVRKAMQSPKLYQRQYYNVIGVFVLIALVNGLYVFTSLNFDVSILSFGIGSLIVEYYVYSFSPRELILHMASSVLTDMKESVLLFDNEERCIYRNDVAETTFGTRFGQFEDVCRFFGIQENAIHEHEVEYQNKNYSIRYNKLFQEEKNAAPKKIGSYLIIEDITARVERRKAREYNMNHDSLTGLYNWHYFELLARELMNAHPDTRYSIALTNIYEFKLYNEVFGRDAGDELIMTIGRLFRESFVSDQIVFARAFDDKFVMCIPTEKCTEENIKAYHIVEPVHNDQFKILNYVGIYHVEDRNESIATMVERAAIALNTIKGSNQYSIIFDQGMRADLLWENTLVSIFQDALTDGEFQIYIQPQVELHSNQLVGGEALVRWIRKDGEIISPAGFISILERKGMINMLDRYIWEESFRFAKELVDKGCEVPISVNISAQDFYHCDLYEVFTGLAEKYELSPQYIRLEITESEMLRDVDMQAGLIKRLQAAGFIFEMDDFGSGYSSLNSLKDLPVNVVKLDMKFMEGTAESTPKSRWIVEAIIRLASAHDIPVIMEGVEMREQVKFLDEMGCKFIQGYYYSRPLAKEEFINYRIEHGYQEMW